ncbi:MAG: hypothetical protein M1819_002060 [Sarea resinae]|nr:MAG: hypothetical protein M1819_002060 [Sarea resinae]
MTNGVQGVRGEKGNGKAGQGARGGGRGENSKLQRGGGRDTRPRGLSGFPPLPPDSLWQATYPREFYISKHCRNPLARLIVFADCDDAYFMSSTNEAPREMVRVAAGYAGDRYPVRHSGNSLTKSKLAMADVLLSARLYVRPRQYWLDPALPEIFQACLDLARGIQRLLASGQTHEAAQTVWRLGDKVAWALSARSAGFDGE